MYTRGCIGFCSVCLFSPRPRDGVRRLLPHVFIRSFMRYTWSNTCGLSPRVLTLSAERCPWARRFVCPCLCLLALLGGVVFMCASMSEDRLCIGACLVVSWVRVPAPVQGVGVLGVAAVDAVAAIVVLGLCEQLAAVLRRGAAGLQVPVLVAFARAHRKRPGRCGTYRASLAESRFCPSCSLGLRSSY